MNPIGHTLTQLAVALGIGLLIGVERERSKGRGPERQVAGLRTFALTSLAGALALVLGGEAILVGLVIVVGLLLAAGYLSTRRHDPGLTTEIALLTTLLLGAWSTREPAYATAVAVVVAIILAARSRLHRLVRDVLTEQEVHDGLLLAAAALVVLPLTPTAAVDPWGIVHPRKLWALVVLVMAINSVGYLALRTTGPRFGLAVAGLCSGFVSSTATVGAMGARARASPLLRRGAVAGAALSSVATVVQLAIVLALVEPTVLLASALPLAAAGIAALAYGAWLTLRSARVPSEGEITKGRAFDPRTAVIFALTVGVALAVSALLTRWLGERGLVAATLLTGFADAHAAAISAASLAAGGRATVDFAVWAVLAGFTTNTVSKLLVAFVMGDRRYALALLPGLLLMTVLAWLAALARLAFT